MSGAIRTVRVRIAVAIDASGAWSACGGTHCTGDEDAREWLYLEDLKEGEHYYWVEADVPVPSNEIEGTLAGEIAG